MWKLRTECGAQNFMNVRKTMTLFFRIVLNIWWKKELVHSPIICAISQVLKKSSDLSKTRSLKTKITASYFSFRMELDIYDVIPCTISKSKSNLLRQSSTYFASGKCS